MNFVFDLGDPLRCAHDIGRVDGLVGRDQDEFRGTVSVCGQRDRTRAQHVVLDRLADLMLEHGDMLVSSGMEHHLGPVFFEDLGDAGGVTHIAQTERKMQVREFLLQLHLQRIEVELAVFEQDQICRFECRDLPAQFRAD